VHIRKEIKRTRARGKRWIEKIKQDEGNVGQGGEAVDHNEA
jgi:hypothetical protein